jgi:hypothetical protein
MQNANQQVSNIRTISKVNAMNELLTGISKTLVSTTQSMATKNLYDTMNDNSKPSLKEMNDNTKSSLKEDANTSPTSTGGTSATTTAKDV